MKPLSAAQTLFKTTSVFVLILIFIFLIVTAAAQSAPNKLANLDAGLQQLVTRYHTAINGNQKMPNLNALQKSVSSSHLRSASKLARMRSDRTNRVLINVLSDGKTSVDQLATLLEQRGGRVLARDPNYRSGIVSAYVPVNKLEALSTASGVRAVLAAHKPKTNAGLTTSQGASVLRTDVANAAGFDGAGVTVGLLSDSFNTSSGFGVADTALSDVLSGDLPNTTAIPGGEGLKFLIELDPNDFGPFTDEGRAMAQIVHDLAPGASLCFATGFISDVDFANNIRTLRTDPACNADVIADDVEFEDEPFFSDGIIALAVDDVASSNSLPGHKVIYFAAAGNDAQNGYSSDLRIIPDFVARSLPATNSRISLSTIPTDIDTSGGFHNFNAHGGKQLAEDIVFSDGTDISFQWDDPFDLNPSGVSTDLNLLFFDPTDGSFLFAVNDDNFQTNRPIELFSLFTGGGPGTTAEVLMAVARTKGGSHLAKRIKYVAFGGISDADGLITPRTAMSFGHNSALGANSVAASEYNTDPAFFWSAKIQSSL